MSTSKKETVKVEVVLGVEGPALYIGDDDTGHRLSGPKPWGGGRTVHSFKVDAAELARELKSYAPNSMPVPDYPKFISHSVFQYDVEMFVAFDPTTDGAIILGAFRSQAEAERQVQLCGAMASRDQAPISMATTLSECQRLLDQLPALQVPADLRKALDFYIGLNPEAV